MRACHVLFARQLREVCVALPKERSPALALALKCVPEISKLRLRTRRCYLGVAAVSQPDHAQHSEWVAIEPQMVRGTRPPISAFAVWMI